MQENNLSLWVVYDHPLDHPDKYVARRWNATTAHPTPTEDVLTADDLHALREMMPPGLVKIPRHGGDDPVIVESWV